MKIDAFCKERRREEEYGQFAGNLYFGDEGLLRDYTRSMIQCFWKIDMMT
jgi:hypothetical protein